MPRKIAPATLWRAAEATLVRFACEFPPGIEPGHDHSICVMDDVSYGADLLTQLAAAVAAQDDDATLRVLGTISAALEP